MRMITSLNDGALTNIPVLPIDRHYDSTGQGARTEQPGEAVTNLPRQIQFTPHSRHTR